MEKIRKNPFFETVIFFEVPKCNIIIQIKQKQILSTNLDRSLD